MSQANPFIQSLILGFKVKAFHFYGRSSRSEFWYFYITSFGVLGLSFLFNLIPIVGSLLQAVIFILVIVCQITAIIRRLHDSNLPGYLATIPYILPIVYLLARQPIHALYPESTWVLTALGILSVVVFFGLLGLCLRKGTHGANRFGTDPLDSSTPKQDFINPQHFADPEYLGDPWRKFKAKVDKQKQDASNGNTPAYISRAVPSTAPTPNQSEIEQSKTELSETEATETEQSKTKDGNH